MAERVTRRGFIGGSAAALGFAFAGAGSLDPFVREAAAAATGPAKGYGPLQYRPGRILALPEGFDYKVLGEVGKRTAGGLIHPDDPDAMGVFPGPDGGSVVVSNHENGPDDEFVVPHDEGIVFDPGARGGTSTMIVDAQNNLTGHYASLAGTVNNCAGGITPWGTWLSCEETEVRRGAALQFDHGYVFEVDPAGPQANVGRSGIPLKFLGRYSHEACAVDPDSGAIHLTEDAGGPNGLYYRWTPPVGYRQGAGVLHELSQNGTAINVGKLEAMKCFDADGNHVPDLAAATDVNTRYHVEWVEVPDRDAAKVSVRKQFSNDQITRARKLEGQWWADGGAYFVSSFARLSDGSVAEHDGQVWHYDPKWQTIRLKTIFGVNIDPGAEGTNFDGPDNITVSPHGGLIMAEDGNGKSHLVGVTTFGKAYPLALNQTGDSEFCGPAFNAAGDTLFVNIQSGPGYTLAITGPWGRPSNAAV